MNFTQFIADIVDSLFAAQPEVEGRRRHFAYSQVHH
jgi:hypothetical protein